MADINVSIVDDTPITTSIADGESFSVVNEQENLNITVEDNQPINATLADDEIVLQFGESIGIIQRNTLVVGEDEMVKYIVHDVDEEGTTTYIGSQNRDGAWLLKKVVETGEDADITFANESNNGTYTTYVDAWTNRATLTYADINTLTFEEITQVGIKLLDSTGDDITDSNPLPIKSMNDLIPTAHDHIDITYVTAGNGLGEVETVTYKTGGSGGTTVATLTLTYDANDNLATVTRS